MTDLRTLLYHLWQASSVAPRLRSGKDGVLPCWRADIRCDSFLQRPCTCQTSPCPRAFCRSRSGAAVQAGGTRGQLGTDAFCDRDKCCTHSIAPANSTCRGAVRSARCPSGCAALSLPNTCNSLGLGQPSAMTGGIVQPRLLLPRLRRNEVSLDCAAAVAW